MPERATVSLTLGKVADEATQRNFRLIEEAFRTLAGICGGVLTKEVDLVVGVNRVRPSVPRPRGRVTVYQDVASDLSDGGLDGDDWLLTASTACRVVLLFF